MPECLRNSVVVPVHKSGKKLSIGDNFQPVSLASSLSEILEHIILARYSQYKLSSSYFQFGFKPGCSTSLCTGLIKKTLSPGTYFLWFYCV